MLSRRVWFWLVVMAGVCVFAAPVHAAPEPYSPHGDQVIDGPGRDPGDPDGGDGDADDLLLYSPNTPPDVQVVKIDQPKADDGPTGWSWLRGVILRMLERYRLAAR